jgi:hypothetical protein
MPRRTTTAVASDDQSKTSHAWIKPSEARRLIGRGDDVLKALVARGLVRCHQLPIKGGWRLYNREDVEKLALPRD